MKENALRELYIDELRDMYHAENRLVQVLPRMAKAATSATLRAGFEKHLEETKGHVERLEEIFARLDKKPSGKECRGMLALLEESQDMIEEKELESEVLDAGLISAAQRVEHYQIAAYGCLRTYATLLGEDEAAALLEQTLQEERGAGEKLTKLAESLRVEAAGAGGGTQARGKGRSARA